MVVKDLIKSKNPIILLIQETKMKAEYVSKIQIFLWRSNNVVVEDTRGVYEGLCIIWSEHEVSLEHYFRTQYWILTKFHHMQSNTSFVIFNVYMSTKPTEKVECWRTLSRLKNLGFSENCIIPGNLNIIETSAKKKGGFLGETPFKTT